MDESHRLITAPVEDDGRRARVEDENEQPGPRRRRRTGASEEEPQRLAAGVEPRAPVRRLRPRAAHISAFDMLRNKLQF